MSKEIEVGSDFSGIGAFDYALLRNNKKTKKVFACDMDKFARKSYVYNHGTESDKQILETEECIFIDNCYYNEFINKNAIKPTKEDWIKVKQIEEKVARSFSFYYPWNVYSRLIPEKSIDIYMTSPPCQSFSLAGKRKGKDSENGILFFNSHEFIKINKPKSFIFENVKGLLSDDKTDSKDEFGNTFKEWCNMLGGKSVNGNPVIFPFENSVPYHIYFKVLNSKKHGVPQNRERVFIVGIREDEDNFFTWPKEEHLTKKLKDILENDVDEKYFLSENAVNRLCNNDSGFGSVPKDGNDVASTICASDYKIARGMNVLKVKSATSKGYETATENDSINFTHPDSKTRRGRVGKEVAQTLDTSCNQAVIDNFRLRRLTPRECFRAQDFPDTFKFVVSNSQLYKQAGNSITVRVLELILSKFKL